MSGSLLHVVVKYTLHRLFEQHFYRIISELFSSGSVLCVSLLTLIFQRVSLHIVNLSDEGNYCDVMNAVHTLLTILRFIWTISVYSLRLINIIS